MLQIPAAGVPGQWDLVGIWLLLSDVRSFISYTDSEKKKKKKKKSAEDLIYMPSFVVIQISRVGIRISFFPGRYLIISEQRIAGAENPIPTFTKMPPFSASSAPRSGSAHGEGRNTQPPNFISQVNAVRKCF